MVNLRHGDPMISPSQTPEAAGLEDAGHIVWWKAGGDSYYPKGENFTVSASCRVEPLVTAASAQAVIDAEKARADRLADIVRRCVAALDASRSGGEYPDFEEWEKDARAALQQETQPYAR